MFGTSFGTFAGRESIERVHLVFNPAAGRRRSGRRQGEISAFLRDRGVEAVWHVTGGRGHATEIVHGLPDDALVASVGGDGTAHEVAAACSGTSRTMAVLPVGSGNDYVKALGVGTDLGGALRMLADGEPKLVDTGVVSTENQSGIPFNNGLGIGFDAQVAEGVASAPRGLGGPGGYLYSVGRLLRGFECKDVGVRLDGEEPSASETILVAVALGTTYGAIFRFTPDARLDDGRFDVVWTTKVSIADVLRLLPRVLRGTHVGHPRIRTARATEVEIELSEPLPAHVDGELLKPARRFEIRLLPNNLRIVAPRSSEPSY
ncbi:diacylglycerol/lipid kinase family protein [Rubrobacter aplysinae]|uniref:diacylglycerol/lipid kinase family protein n=1 Tax=Rubrobacter aplysinae TaxID=909625 RepID=UPI00069DE414|nr:diacylglycerol kinase family protein [Rubrobacter aplysinae]